jgi:bacterioferritin-associated ferredoxin
MYVCLCEAITDKQIKNAVRTYEITSLKGLRQILPIGRDCGKCIRQAREILQAEQITMAEFYVTEVA